MCLKAHSPKQLMYNYVLNPEEVYFLVTCVIYSSDIFLYSDAWLIGFPNTFILDGMLVFRLRLISARITWHMRQMEYQPRVMTLKKSRLILINMSAISWKFLCKVGL